MKRSRMVVDYTEDRRRDLEPAYRALWGSVINMVITDACDFSHPGFQADALDWLFNDANKRDRDMVFGTLGVNFDAYRARVARTVIGKARAKGAEPFLRSPWGWRLGQIANGKIRHRSDS